MIWSKSGIKSHFGLKMSNSGLSKKFATSGIECEKCLRILLSLFFKNALKQNGVVKPGFGFLYSSKNAKTSSKFSVTSPVLKQANLLSAVNATFFSYCSFLKVNSR